MKIYERDLLSPLSDMVSLRDLNLPSIQGRVLLDKLPKGNRSSPPPPQFQNTSSTNRVIALSYLQVVYLPILLKFINILE